MSYTHLTFYIWYDVTSNYDKRTSITTGITQHGVHLEIPLNSI